MCKASHTARTGRNTTGRLSKCAWVAETHHPLREEPSVLDPATVNAEASVRLAVKRFSDPVISEVGSRVVHMCSHAGESLAQMGLAAALVLLLESPTEQGPRSYAYSEAAIKEKIAFTT